MARLNYVQIKTPTWMQAAMDMCAAELTAHGAYSLVDTVNSPGGMPCLVFKCSGAQSPLGRDWYLCMARLTANPTTLYFAVAEGYDTTNKALIRPAPGTNQTSTIPASDTSYGGGTAYPIWSGTTGSTLNTTDIHWDNHGPAAGVNTDNWTLVTQKGLWFWGNQPGRSSSYNSGTYAGWIEPLQSTDPGIIVSGDFLAGTQAIIYATRHPTATTALGYNWRFYGPANSICAWTPFAGQVNGGGDRFFNGRPVGGRRILRTNDPVNYGDLRGVWPDLLTINETSVQPGEQMTIYDQQGVGSTYIYAYRYGSSCPMWLNTAVP